MISKLTPLSFLNKSSVALKAISLLYFTLVLNFVQPTRVYAGSINLTCRVDSSGTRSIIRLYGTGLKGKYFAKVFSGENVVRVDEKAAKANGVVDFRFDSEPTVIGTKPDTIAIAPDFIKGKEVAGVLRKAKTLARVGAVRANCKTLKANQ